MSTNTTAKTYEVTADCIGPKRATVTTRDLTVDVDAPEASGGTNRGPTPVEYLLVSLAGCLNVAGTHVAGEMGIDIAVREVTVSADLDPTKYRTGEGERAGYSRIRVAIDVETSEDEATVEAWRRETEARTPVLDNLLSPTPVRVAVGRR